jgi:hypothetical protein
VDVATQGMNFVVEFRYGRVNLRHLKFEIVLALRHAPLQLTQPFALSTLSTL